MELKILVRVINAMAEVRTKRGQWKVRKKIEVLDWYHANGSVKRRTVRRFSLSSTAQLRQWLKTEDKIRVSRKDSFKAGAGKKTPYPVMDAELHQAYLEARAKGIEIHQSWFHDKGITILRRVKPDAFACDGHSSDFDPSEHLLQRGWLRGFFGRHNISLRRPTNQSQTDVATPHKKKLIKDFITDVNAGTYDDDPSSSDDGAEKAQISIATQLAQYGFSASESD